MYLFEVFIYQRKGNKLHRMRKLLNFTFMPILMGHPVPLLLKILGSSPYSCPPTGVFDEPLILILIFS